APPAPAPPAPPGSVLHLTFDDGPDPTWTPQVLSVLAKHNAHATFFVLGRAAGAHPGLVADERAAGHSVGNHTTTHPDLTKLSVADITSQWQRTANVIGGTPCARPPYGAVNATVRQVTTGLGYRVQLWDIDTRDWSRPGADVITQRIVDGARPGAVVLLHDGGNDRSQTVAALDAALTRLDAAGWRYEAIPGC
ncbi:polysaccharide deacetylase family protein, partial [Phycicoccus elongatus]|uniref:polysaccharide deacetylase family protein n=4 Tax=Phycicoccus TaxID=367298 RepID=UPI000A0149A2